MPRVNDDITSYKINYNTIQNGINSSFKSAGVTGNDLCTVNSSVSGFLWLDKQSVRWFTSEITSSLHRAIVLNIWRERERERERERGKEGGRERGREGGREGEGERGREGEREGGREGGREGEGGRGRERERERRGREGEGGRGRGRGGREGGREEGREGERELNRCVNVFFHNLLVSFKAL